MKRIYLVLLLIVGVPSALPAFLGLGDAPPEPEKNKVFTALNHWHDLSSKWWQHQEGHSLDAHRYQRLKHGLRGEDIPTPVFPDDENGEARKAWLLSRRSDVPPVKLGAFVEGAGELADIASLTSSNPKFIKWANAIALASRASDVAMGLFPQISGAGIDFSRLRFIPRGWFNLDKTWDKNVSLSHITTHLANQAGKAWDIQRAGNRIKNAKLIAWYNKKFVSPKRRRKLHVVQALHALALIAGLIIKNKQQDKMYMEDRYPWLIGEAVVSLLRRLHMRYIQTKMLNDAHDEWAVANEIGEQDALSDEKLLQEKGLGSVVKDRGTRSGEGGLSL